MNWEAGDYETHSEKVNQLRNNHGLLRISSGVRKGDRADQWESYVDMHRKILVILQGQTTDRIGIRNVVKDGFGQQKVY